MKNNSQDHVVPCTYAWGFWHYKMNEIQDDDPILAEGVVVQPTPSGMYRISQCLPLMQAQ